jgi:hypothetical protein
LATDKRTVLASISFGQRVAEEELQELSRYFVQTEQWRRLLAGEADVVYGAKGAGKSALYATLIKHEDDLRGRGILLVSAENPRGQPVFKDLVDDPPTSEAEFRNLWKVYFLQLLGQRFREEELDSAEAKQFVAKLEESALLPRGGGLKALVRTALDYVRLFAKPQGIETAIKLDPASGMPAGFSGKIFFKEPSAAAAATGIVSVEALFALADEALVRADLSIWLLFDRLDVAFAESLDLEQNALRALFVAYADVRQYERLTPKIFLRSDIWTRITAAGFREASHITKTITISWDQQQLMNLLVRRILQSDEVAEYYSIKATTVLADVAAQDALFYRIFPAQVDVGSRRPTTYDWILSRTRDSQGSTAPRELIHLLSEAREEQLKRYDIGEAAPADEALVAGQTLKKALEEVSRVRLNQTLFAEFPALRPLILKLKASKTQQTIDSLMDLWRMDVEKATEAASQLVDVGFFEQRGSDYWVPFLYRDALEMVQGTVD